MKITILGCGRWGSFLAWYFNRIGYEVLLWGRETSAKLKVLEMTRQNDYVRLPEAIRLSASLNHSLSFSENIIIAIAEQSLRHLMSDIINYDCKQKKIILSMKGLENKTCKRLSEVVKEFIPDDSKIAVLLGPGHPKELIQGIPTCMIVDSIDNFLKMWIAEKFTSALITYHVGSDLIGNEIGAAAKNVIGIAGGMLDGMGYMSLKGALMVVGTSEIAKLIYTLGGNQITSYGLSCLGDYQASLFSENSNSVNFGKAFVKKQHYTNHIPGLYTIQTIMEIINLYKLDLPLCRTVYDVIFCNANSLDIISTLLQYNYSGDKNV